MKKIQVKLRRDLLSNRWLFLAVTVVIIFGVALFCSSLLAFLNLKTMFIYNNQVYQLCLNPEELLKQDW